MAAFAPSFTLTESEDGLTVTIVNTSFLSSNDEGYVKTDFTTLEVVLTDAYGTELATIDFVGASDTQTYAKSVDTWITGTMSLAGIATYSLIQEYAIHRITQTKLDKVLDDIDCCSSIRNIQLLTKVDMFVNGYKNDKFIEGNQISYQKNIEYANIYLDLIIAA